MVDSTRALILAVALVAARAHIASHDNILRIQLWDSEGLSKVPISTEPPPTARAVSYKHNSYKTKVNLDTLYKAMLNEGYNSKLGRFSRHRYRHRRRRTREIGTDVPWRFHSGDYDLNVALYEGDVSLDGVNSEVSDTPDGHTESPPERLVQDDEEEEEVKKKLPVVPKCCPSGQNLTMNEVNKKLVCARSTLTFQPLFFQSNETHMWPYDSNVFETIVGNPCLYGRYKLDPDSSSDDQFYLLLNGSLFTPLQMPTVLGARDYCMETFWNDTNPAGDTLPMICFPEPIDEAKTSETLIAYAVGLMISVPFLLATSCIYTFIRELRDTHGKALACHSTCLAIAFSCLAATQLAGHAFPLTVCTIMAYSIQFSFVSCFFWLNVMCFDTYLNVRRYICANVTRRSMRKRFAWYCAYAVLLPLILLIVTVTMELSPAVPSTYLKPNFGVKGCWFKTDQSALPYFYGPVATILFTNIILFFLTSRAFAVHYDKLKDITAMDLAHSDYSTDDDWVRLGEVLGEPVTLQDRSTTPPGRPVNISMRLKKYRKIFRTCCLLSAIMGLSWVMEVVSWAVSAGSSVMSVWSVFDVINALQGVVVFAIYVLQQPMRSIVKKHMCKGYSSSEAAVVSERTSIDCGSGRRDYV